MDPHQHDRLDEVAELTYHSFLISQSAVSDPLNQGAYNLESISTWDSASGFVKVLGAVNSTTAVGSTDDEANIFDDVLFYDLTPFSTTTIEFYESSTSYTYSQLTPEPSSMAAMALGVGLLALRSRKRSRSGNLAGG